MLKRIRFGGERSLKITKCTECPFSGTSEQCPLTHCNERDPEGNWENCPLEDVPKDQVLEAYVPGDIEISKDTLIDGVLEAFEWKDPNNIANEGSDLDILECGMIDFIMALQRFKGKRVEILMREV